MAKILIFITEVRPAGRSPDYRRSEMEKLIKKMAQDDVWRAWNSANSAAAGEKNGCISATAKSGCISAAPKAGCIS
ncbi:hypothetical protein AB0G74_07590 [Streptomyces sp. NPDC020875]|uniref:hypothetical protein n=1 Tax=Streptomyces sp. NPDC020875 TaxID=3154898 RepID=UPI0033EB0E82